MIGFRRKVVCSLAIALALMYCSVMGQSETINFPPSSGVADITKAPYNADPHGQADASAAIQAAFEANKGIHGHILSNRDLQNHQNRI